MDIQATPGERNQRPRAGRAGRQVRRPVRGGGNAWSTGWTGTEQLSMDLAFSDAPCGKARGQVTDEGRWSADVEAGIPRRTQLLKHSYIQASTSVEIHTWPVLGIGRAVADVTVAVSQGFEECAGFLGKRMLTAAASPV